MGKKSTPPPPVDPTIAINAQKNANIQSANASAALDHTNQVTPWGNLTWTNKKGAATFDQAGYDAALAAAKASNPSNRSAFSKLFSGVNAMMSTPSFNPASLLTDEFGKTGTVDPLRDRFTTYAPDEWSSAITLDPDQQKLLDQQNASSLSLGNTSQKLLGNVDQNMSKPLDFSGLTGIKNGALSHGVGYGSIQNDVNMDGIPDLVGGDKLYGSMRDAQDASYRQATSRLDPTWQQDQHDLENRLTQQGIMQNSDAWNRATESFGRNKNDAYMSARNNAVQEGNAAEAQLYGQGLSSNQNAYGQRLNNANFHNSAQNQGFGQSLANAQLNNQASGQEFSQSMAQRNQGMNELMTQRENPLNELNALRSGSQVTNPSFTNTPNFNVANTDVNGPMQAFQNAQLGLYNSKVGQQNSNMQTIGTIATAAATAF